MQNVRAGGSMIDKVRRIQEAGMEVWGGMIVGFDHDDESTFAGQQSFFGAARISIAMVGMLSAIPKTPLHARLAAAGRIDPAENPAYGTNVIPLRMSREELTEGYVRLMDNLYKPKAYFDHSMIFLLQEELKSTAHGSSMPPSVHGCGAAGTFAFG